MKFKLKKKGGKKGHTKKERRTPCLVYFQFSTPMIIFLGFWVFGGLGFDLSLSPWERGTLLITHDDRSTISISD